LQADVGAGKTAVAVYALLVTVANQHQAALMAPTELLARPHAETLDRYLAGSQVRRLLLTGGLPPRARREALARLEDGSIDLVIGTQALVQEDVRFARLGLVVVDEQHRFGVHQRARFRRLGIEPHYLVMTATPIPRTLALTVFGDLDCSVIRELPPGRQPVRTRWVEERRRDGVYERLREQMRAGRQAFVICPVIDNSPKLEALAATDVFEQLRAGPCAGFRLGLLHGRLDDAEKADVMDRFRQHDLDLLVCTSVVEVGVDVPNATLLVIEQAERFGLSQLHQLRGRISRGTIAGECYLFGQPSSAEAEARLRSFCQTTDGFSLAEMDARLRGFGELLGARQHGAGDLRLAEVAAHPDLLRAARDDAFTLLTKDPALRAPEHALLRRAVLERYGATMELAEVG
jgi:ATP-dependent DNA helicase RecG